MLPSESVSWSCRFWVFSPQIKYFIPYYSLKLSLVDKGLPTLGDYLPLFQFTHIPLLQPAILCTVADPLVSPRSLQRSLLFPNPDSLTSNSEPATSLPGKSGSSLVKISLRSLGGQF